MSWQKFGTVYEAFRASAQGSPEAPFLRIVADVARRYGIEPKSLTYGTALREVERLAAVYTAANLGPGCRVALLLGNRPEFFLHWLALNAIGVSVVPLNPDWGAAEVQYVLEHSGAMLAVAEAKRRKDLDDAAKPLTQPPTVVDLTMAQLADFAKRYGSKPDVLAQRPATAETECALLYTSGTTGKPKGCVLSNQYFLWGGEWPKAYMVSLPHIHVSKFCSLVLRPHPAFHHLQYGKAGVSLGTGLILLC